MAEGRANYAPLRQHDSAEHCSEVTSDKIYNTNHHSWVIRWSIIIIIACTFLDVLLVGFIGVFRSKSRSSSASSPEPLELRSQYVNLHRLYENPDMHSSPHPPIVNNPSLIAQVSHVQRSQVFSPDSTGAWFSASGLVVPEDRAMLVTEDVSSLYFYDLAVIHYLADIGDSPISYS